MLEVLPMIMDAMIICLLSGTIFFAARLSHHIKVFRESREEMESLLNSLSSQITIADQAIDGLRANARESGRDLQQVINEAKALSEELQIMSQSGDRLASRIEKLAGQPSAPRMAVPSESEIDEHYSSAPAPSSSANTNQEKPFSGFAIRDPEFEEDLPAHMDEQGLMPGDYETDVDEQLISQAEQDLYQALKSKGKAKTGAGGIS